LTQVHFPFVIVEVNHQRMLDCKQAEFPVIYGDMTQPTVIGTSKLQAAVLLLITTPSTVTAHIIVKQAHRLKPELHIIASATGLDQTRDLYESGVYMAVLPEMEAGLEMTRQTLLHLKKPVTLIQQYTDAIRRQAYAPLYEASHDHQLLARLDNIKALLEISWIALTAQSPIIGTSIKDAAVRTETGASVVGVVRNAIFHPNPMAEYVFEEVDLVAIVGSQQEQEAFKKLSGTV